MADTFSKLGWRYWSRTPDFFLFQYAVFDKWNEFQLNDLHCPFQYGAGYNLPGMYTGLFSISTIENTTFAWKMIYFNTTMEDRIYNNSIIWNNPKFDISELSSPLKEVCKCQN